MSSPAPIGLNQPWLLGAPATKLMLIASVVGFIVYESNQLHDHFAVDTNAILNQGEFYRFVTGRITFASTGELLLGLAILSVFSRRFEREMGTRRYCTFLVGVSVFSAVMEIVLAQLLLPDDGLRYAGPYPTLGALVGLFHRYAPRLYPRFFGVLGFSFSEKSAPYLFGVQMMLYHGWSTAIPSVCGVLAGYTLASFALDVPDALANASLFARFRDAPPGLLVPRPHRGENSNSGRAHRRRPQQDAPATLVQPAFEQLPPPPESVVEQLTSMGFERDAVMRALRASHNNLERAADRLLTGTS